MEYLSRMDSTLMNLKTKIGLPPIQAGLHKGHIQMQIPMENVDLNDKE